MFIIGNNFGSFLSRFVILKRLCIPIYYAKYYNSVNKPYKKLLVLPHTIKTWYGFSFWIGARQCKRYLNMQKDVAENLSYDCKVTNYAFFLEGYNELMIFKISL